MSSLTDFNLEIQVGRSFYFAPKRNSIDLSFYLSQAFFPAKIRPLRHFTQFLMYKISMISKLLCIISPTKYTSQIFANKQFRGISTLTDLITFFAVYTL